MCNFVLYKQMDTTEKLNQTNQINMKKILLSLVCLLTLTLPTLAQTEVVKLSFDKTKYETSVQNYTTTWTYSTDTNHTWNIANFSNNQKAWEYVRCGAKNQSNENTASIATKFAIPEAIDDIVLRLSKLQRGSLKFTVEIADNDNFTNPVVTDSVEWKGSDEGDLHLKISSPVANNYYRVVANYKNSSTTNGVVDVISISYQVSSAVPTSCAAPEFSVDGEKAEGSVDVYGGNTISVACPTMNSEVIWSVTKNNEAKEDIEPLEYTLPEDAVVGDVFKFTAQAMVEAGDDIIDSNEVSLLVNVIAKPIVATTTYTLVTDASAINEDDEYILAAGNFKSGTVNYGVNVMGNAKNAGFEATRIADYTGTMPDELEIENTITVSSLKFERQLNASTGNLSGYKIKIGTQYLDGSTVKKMKLTETGSEFGVPTIGKDKVFVIESYNAEGTLVTGTIQYTAQNSNGGEGNGTFNNYSASNKPVYLYKKVVVAEPVAPEMPTVDLGDIVLDGDYINSNNKVTLKFNKVEGVTVYYRLNPAQNKQNAQRREAAEEHNHDGFTAYDHESNGIELTKDHGSIEYFACHDASQLHSDVKTLNLNVETGVTEIEATVADAAGAEYFNLQGVRVMNPIEGIYIRVANGKATKVIVK